MGVSPEPEPGWFKSEVARLRPFVGSVHSARSRPMRVSIGHNRNCVAFNKPARGRMLFAKLKVVSRKSATWRIVDRYGNTPRQSQTADRPLWQIAVTDNSGRAAARAASSGQERTVELVLSCCKYVSRGRKLSFACGPSILAKRFVGFQQDFIDLVVVKKDVEQWKPAS